MDATLTDAVPAVETPLAGSRNRFARNPLDAVLDATNATPANGVLTQFLGERSPWSALLLWIGPDVLRGPDRRRRIAQRLTRDIARLDDLISAQASAILLHPALQKLEASWRGLHYLVHQVAEGENLKIEVLSLTWKELARDLERALEFDQSQLFRKVYNEEFGTAGGEPYGILLADYEIRPRPGPDHPIDDLAALTAIASIAAAAFAPFIAAAHPSVLELNSFTELELPQNLARTFDQVEYLKWRAFRDTDDSRFVGLTLPRVLMRSPYADDGSRADGFRFRGELGGHLWGTAVYAFGAVVVRAFMQSGWPAAIRGVERGVEAGGLVTDLCVPSFRTDRPGVAAKCATDTVITDAQEKELGELGFIPLCHCQDTELAAFYGNQSVQKPKVYDELSATVNARLSAMLQYMLCVARFAHYLKVMARDKVGSYTGPGEIEDYLRRWLMNYTSGNDNATPEMKAQYPLREAKVLIRERPDKPGTYSCVIHLRPHFQLDQMVTAVKLVTELAPMPAG